jgi:transcriptional regulator with XRE-family HTH domain
MPMTARERKAALVAHGKRQRDIARKTGFGEPYVSEVLKGTRRSEPIERAIAEAIGRPVADVFPPRDDAAA